MQANSANIFSPAHTLQVQWKPPGENVSQEQ
jgi:hypothetical protein